MRIYIAAPLFNDSEKERNVRLRDALREWGHDTYLPQEDGDIAFTLIAKGGNPGTVRKQIFNHDLKEIKGCDILLCVIDGRVPDEGACVELGMAYALGKRCIGYKTDSRALDRYGDNLMIDGCLESVVKDMKRLKQAMARASK